MVYGVCTTDTSITYILEYLGSNGLMWKTDYLINLLINVGIAICRAAAGDFPDFRGKRRLSSLFFLLGSPQRGDPLGLPNCRRCGWPGPLALNINIRLVHLSEAFPLLAPSTSRSRDLSGRKVEHITSIHMEYLHSSTSITRGNDQMAILRSA